MSNLFGNHIVGFPTRRLICNINSNFLMLVIYLRKPFWVHITNIYGMNVKIPDENVSI